MTRLILSHFQTHPLLALRESSPATLQSSPDLGLTSFEIRLENQGVLFPPFGRLPWTMLQEIDANPNNCFVWENGQLRKTIVFSEATDRVYSLLPTLGAPTMLVSGIPMHRIKGTTPERDTSQKIKASGSTFGPVLDTATGLGYTAIAAARSAASVLTVELDPAVLELARMNPWSQELFENTKIEQRLGDSSQIVLALPDSAFSCILHDPPMLSLAGELYGLEFYRQLLRVLRPGGRLFHYIGDPDSSTGARVTRGVVERLKKAGFTHIDRHPKAFGVLAKK